MAESAQRRMKIIVDLQIDGSILSLPGATQSLKPLVKERMVPKHFAVHGVWSLAGTPQRERCREHLYGHLEQGLRTRDGGRPRESTSASIPVYPATGLPGLYTSPYFLDHGQESFAPKFLSFPSECMPAFCAISDLTVQVGDAQCSQCIQSVPMGRSLHD